MKLKNLLTRADATVRQSPAEMVLVAAFVVYALVAVWGTPASGDAQWRMSSHLFLWLPAFTIAYVLHWLQTPRSTNANSSTEHKADSSTEHKEDGSKPCPRTVWRWCYRLSPLLLVPFLFVDIREWVGTAQFITMLGLCPAVVLLHRWRRDNAVFAADVVHWLSCGGFAVVLAGITHGLLMAIYYSLHYVFPKLPLGDEGNVMFSMAILCWGAVMPLTFLFFDRGRDDVKDAGDTVKGASDAEFIPVPAIDIIANWVVTPALLIYTAILYAYFVKIAVVGELPRGGVAGMVFAFTIVALVVKAYRPLMGVRRFAEWFFERFSLISLPALIMFWVGVARRVNDYGLTEQRIYLLICGTVMTFTVLMFLVPYIAKYRYSVLGAAALFAIFAYIPGITAEELTERSQAGRGDTGIVKLAEPETIYLRYNIDPFSVDISGYRTMHNVNENYVSKKFDCYRYNIDYEQFVITSPAGETVLKCPLSLILERQLAKAGVSNVYSAASEKLLEDRFGQMMFFEYEGCGVLINSMSIEVHDGRLRLIDVSVNMLLVK